ncbi:hypothetical protein UlMin_029878 [Ulmus minor]
MPVKLLDSSDSDDEDLSKIEIDKEFARRYEHNKKREDLQRYEELKKKGLISRQAVVEGEEDDDEVDSSESDDDESLYSRKGDLKLFDVLIKVKKKDPILKDPEVKLFEDEEDGEEGEDVDLNEQKNDGKKKKSVYLKDVIAKQLIEDGPEFHDKDENNDNKKLSYNDEQEKIRKEFLEVADGLEEDEDDLLTEKGKMVVVDDDESDDELHKKVDEFFGGELDEKGKFLKEYFMNQMWIDKAGSVDDEELEILSEDEKIEEQEFELEYRHQENAGDRVMGHAREVEGSVRKKVNARKEQRKRKEERMEIARLEREEELRHLKNLKKKEMDDRIKRIMKSAGIREDEVVPLSAKELEEEFDPEEYDRMMKVAFDDKYYGAEDADPEFGSDGDEDGHDIEKPDFDKEDELLGLPKGWDSSETGDGFLAARERILKQKMENDSGLEREEGEGGGEGEEEEGGEEEEEEVSEEGKRKRKRKKSAIMEKAKQAMLEEYYKLDYEDAIGDLKTRFKYAKIKSDRFGLTTADILMLDDKELNQYVSLKKIAPYKEKEWKVPNSQRHQIKMKLKDLLHGKPNDQKTGKKKRRRDDAKASTSSAVPEKDGKAEVEKPAGDVSNLSRKARRRQRQAENKPKPSRLSLYRNADSQPKKKAKH